jgi:hypothetical protein
MRKITLLILLPFVWNITLAQQTKDIEGRWDLTIDRDGRKFPSWLEVVHSGTRTLVGYFVGISGSARPISKINVEGSKFNFSIPPQWETGDQDLKLEGNFRAGLVSGNVTFPDGKTYAFTGEKAPLLKAAENVRWGKPVKLLNNNDLTGWTALGRTNQWVVSNGVLSSAKSGANIRTEKTFKISNCISSSGIPKEVIAVSTCAVVTRCRYRTMQVRSQPKATTEQFTVF